MSELLEPVRVSESIPEGDRKLPRLEGWTERRTYVEGTVYDHPRIDDGEYVYTSTVVWLRRDLKLLQTRNTLYALVREIPG